MTHVLLINTLHYLFISVYHGWMNFYKRITILFIYGDVYALFICSEVLIILYPRVNRAYGIHFVLKNSFFALIFCNDGHHKVFITKTFVQIWILDQSTNQCFYVLINFFFFSAVGSCFTLTSYKLCTS
jgi:hypothetical protein